MELERKKQNLQSYWEEESGLENPQDVCPASRPFYIINYVATSFVLGLMLFTIKCVNAHDWKSDSRMGISA